MGKSFVRPRSGLIAMIRSHSLQNTERRVRQLSMVRGREHCQCGQPPHPEPLLITDLYQHMVSLILIGVNLMGSSETELRGPERSCRINLTHKGVNWRWKYVAQVQQQRPKLPSVTLTWHASKYKGHKLHQRYILLMIHYLMVTVGDSGLCCCSCVTYFER